MATPDFRCSISELFIASTAMWTLAAANQPALVLKNTKYTPTFIEDKLEEITNVSLMPDREGREQNSKDALENLHNAIDIFNNLWKDLEPSIDAAYPNNSKNMLMAAGSGHYAGSAKHQWTNASQLMIDTNTFVAANTTALVAGGMPPTLAVQLEDAAKDCNTLHTLSVTADGIVADGGQAKMIACNGVYKSVMSLTAVAKRAFKDNPSMISQFTFSNVVAATGKHSVAGFKGLITDSKTTLPLAGVTGTCPINNYSVMTDAKGRYHIKQMEAGTYTFTFSKAGYQTVTITIEIKASVTSIKSFAMVAA